MSLWNTRVRLSLFPQVIFSLCKTSHAFFLRKACSQRIPEGGRWLCSMTHKVNFRDVKARDAFQMCTDTSTGWNEWWMGSDRSSEVGGRRLPFKRWCFLKVSTDLHARLNFSYFRLAGKPGAEESREGGLGPCCACKEKGLGLMRPHTWRLSSLRGDGFPSLDLV